MSKFKGPRPVCPHCGSLDVVVGDKTGDCNNCGEMFRAEAARGERTLSGGTQRHTAGPKRLTDEPGDDWLEAVARTGTF